MKLAQYTERIFAGVKILTSHIENPNGKTYSDEKYCHYLTVESIHVGDELRIKEDSLFVQKRNLRKYYRLDDEDYVWSQDFIIYERDNTWNCFLYSPIETVYDILLSGDFMVIRPNVPYLQQLLNRKSGQGYIKNSIADIYRRYNDEDKRAKEVNLIVISDNFINKEIEAAKEAEESGRGKKIDLESIRINSKPLSVDKVLKRIEHEEINLSTAFQRKTGLWDKGVKSRLIETIILDMPIPAFYFDASTDSKWLVIDGLQRLSAIKEFVLDGTLKLSGLDYRPELIGATFESLDRKDQRRIEEFDILAYLIEPGTPKQVKYKIFKSINTSALILEPQEIRHALNEGKPAILVEKLSQIVDFRKVIKISIKQQERMLDREIVLRYLAFRVTHFSEYQPPMKDYLNEAMSKLYKVPEEKIEEYKKTFIDSLKTLHRIFGAVVFSRNMYISLERRKYPFNNVLFEIWISAVADLSNEERKELINHKRELKQQFSDLIVSDGNFDKSIDNESANTAGSVLIRFKGVKKIIKSVLE